MGTVTGDAAAGEVLAAALRYVPRTVPLVGKRPPMRDWTNWTANAVTVRSWFSHPTDWTVGIRTGNGLAVLDVDPRDGGDVALAERERVHGPLPATPTVATGGNGLHFYFRAPADLRSRTLAPGLELKATGRQVVAPPSIHPDSGRQYVWVRPLIESEFAQLPEWLARDRVRERDHERDRVRARDQRDDALTAIPATLYVPLLTGQGLGRDDKVCCPFHDLSVGRADGADVSPARSSADASSRDDGGPR